MVNNKKHILIVDDDDRIRNLLKEFLLDYDYFVSTAEDTNQAKNRMNSQHFNVSNKSNGIGWHTDGRFVGNNQLKPSLCYTVIIALEDFTEHNGSTRYISKSHKKNDN